MSSARKKEDKHSKKDHAPADGVLETPEVGKEKSRTAEQEQEKPAQDERLLRLQADFDNFRKRTIREKEDIYRRANQDLMNEILPALDHMDLAFSAVDDHEAHGAFVDGFRLVAEQLAAVLERFGLKAMVASEGEFDPNFHEAISHIESDSIPENCIISQVRKGYMLGDRLLRPAQVVVSRGKTGVEGNSPAMEE